MSCEITEIELCIKRGSTYSHVFTIEDDEGNPVDLTNSTVVMQFRADYESADVIHESNTENNDFSIPVGNDGKLYLDIDHTKTRLLSADAGLFDIDVMLQNGKKKTVAEGTWFVSPDVTR